MSGVARPPRFTGRTCRLCGGPIPWRARTSRGRNLARDFCCADHQARWNRQEGEKRRAALALTDPARAARLEKDAERNLRKKGMKEAERAAHEAACRASRPPTTPAPPPTAPVRPELVLRLAAAGEHEGGMRCAGLSPAEIELALRIQRNGGRIGT